MVTMVGAVKIHEIMIAATTDGNIMVKNLSCNGKLDWLRHLDKIIQMSACHGKLPQICRWAGSALIMQYRTKIELWNNHRMWGTINVGSYIII